MNEASGDEAMQAIDALSDELDEFAFNIAVNMCCERAWLRAVYSHAGFYIDEL